MNVKGRAGCMPCHYTCLTCAGEADNQCTSCFDEAIASPALESSEKLEPVNQGISANATGFIVGPKSDVAIEDVALDDHEILSYGRRETFPLVRREGALLLSKKAVTKKILEPYNKPRPLYYCYPAKMLNQAYSNAWYYRMSVLFILNLVVVLLIVLYFLYCKCYLRRRNSQADDSNLQYRYSKMRNGDAEDLRKTGAANIIYISSTEEE